MRTRLPSYLIAVLSEVIPQSETHASLDNLFMYAGAPGDPPSESKPVKVQEWLRRINDDQSVDPLQILGRLIEGYLEYEPSLDSTHRQFQQERYERILKVLARAGFQYHTGGHVSTGLGAPTRSLEDLIKSRDLHQLARSSVALWTT